MDSEGVNSKNWGWSNGPLSEGHYVRDVYAGAAQNNISKGTIVGNITIDYTGGCVTVTYNTIDGAIIADTHLWIGTTPLYMKEKGYSGNYYPTDAPGQLPYGVSVINEYSWTAETVCGFTGDEIYVAAHAI